MIDFVGEFEVHKSDRAVLATLIAFGLFQCFFGVRFFRVTLSIAGFCGAFVVSATIATHHVDSDKEAYMIGAGAGVAAAILCACFVKMGMLLLGAVAGEGTFLRSILSPLLK